MKNVLTFGIKCAALAIKFLVIYGQDFVVAGPADSKAAALIQGKNYIYKLLFDYQGTEAGSFYTTTEGMEIADASTAMGLKTDPVSCTVM